MCICPQQVCSNGKSTSQTSPSSSRTTARPVCRNNVSLKQVTKREARTQDYRFRFPCTLTGQISLRRDRRVLSCSLVCARVPAIDRGAGLDGREITAGAGAAWGEGPPPQTEP